LESFSFSGELGLSFSFGSCEGCSLGSVSFCLLLGQKCLRFLHFLLDQKLLKDLVFSRRFLSPLKSLIFSHIFALKLGFILGDLFLTFSDSGGYGFRFLLLLFGVFLCFVLLGLGGFGICCSVFRCLLLS
jgi:hypothetical protein